MSRSKSTTRASGASPAEEPSRTWEVVVGENLKAWRNRLGLTAEEVAKSARAWGLDWTRVTVTTIERGKRSFDPKEWVALFPLGLVPSRDLFDTDEWVAYGPHGQVKASAVAAILSGRTDEVDPRFDFRSPAQLEEALAAVQRMAEASFDYTQLWPRATHSDFERAKSAAKGEPEIKAAKALDIEPLELSLMAHYRWGHSFTEHRDRRVAELAEPDASPRRIQALRGWATKELIAELREVHKTVWSLAYELGLEAPYNPDFFPNVVRIPMQVPGTEHWVILHFDPDGRLIEWQGPKKAVVAFEAYREAHPEEEGD